MVVTWPDLESEGWRTRLHPVTNRLSYIRPSGGIVNSRRHLSQKENDEFGDTLFPFSKKRVNRVRMPLSDTAVLPSSSSSASVPAPAPAPAPAPLSDLSLPVTVSDSLSVPVPALPVSVSEPLSLQCTSTSHRDSQEEVVQEVRGFHK